MKSAARFRPVAGLIFIAALAAAAALSSYSREAIVTSGAEVLPNGDIRVQGSGVQPELFFGCDMDSDKLETFFSDAALIANLKALNAGIALGISDFSPARARAVRELNADGIRVIAGLSLPDQGVYLNAGNVREAAARFETFETWTAANGLKWSAVGLDIEPNFSDFAAMRDQKLRLAATLLRRSFDARGVQRGREAYAALIAAIQSRGYPVETIQMNFLADERSIHTTILERLFGIVDVRANDEVLMVYSSFNHAAGAAPVWSYGQQAQSIAIGSTASSGDPSIDARYPPLNWDEFSRDLIVASHFTRTVGVFNLQGCIQQGFLERLRTLDWSQSVIISAGALRRLNRFRDIVETVLWIVAHAIYLAAAALAPIALFIWRLRTRRRARLRAAAAAA